MTEILPTISDEYRKQQLQMAGQTIAYAEEPVPAPQSDTRSMDTAWVTFAAEIRDLSSIQMRELRFVPKLDTARTDAQGRYRLEGLFAGRYQVEVSAEGLHASAVRPERRTLDLEPDEEIEGIEFVLVPAIAISGWVDPAALPLGELEVSLRGAADGEERVRLAPGADGTFSFGGLFPERYELVLLHQGLEMERVPVGPSGALGIVLAAPR